MASDNGWAPDIFTGSFGLTIGFMLSNAFLEYRPWLQSEALVWTVILSICFVMGRPLLRLKGLDTFAAKMAVRYTQLCMGVAVGAYLTVGFFPR